uniref:Wtf14 n=1 Tax=Schizosaccharomyces pombe TaxID=4896 RepID=A0A482AT08_SCHPM|nr:Wtf14 [Schizosaccharomyces pombe]
MENNHHLAKDSLDELNPKRGKGEHETQVSQYTVVEEATIPQSLVKTSRSADHKVMEASKVADTRTAWSTKIPAVLLPVFVINIALFKYLVFANFSTKDRVLFGLGNGGINIFSMWLLLATYETWFRSIKEVIVACGAGIRSFPQKRGVNMLYAILKLTFVNAFAILLLMFFRSHFEQWRLGCPLVERVIGVMLNVAYFIIEIENPGLFTRVFNKYCDCLFAIRDILNRN